MSIQNIAVSNRRLTFSSPSLPLSLPLLRRRRSRPGGRARPGDRAPARPPRRPRSPRHLVPARRRGRRLRPLQRQHRGPRPERRAMACASALTPRAPRRGPGRGRRGDVGGGRADASAEATSVVARAPPRAVGGWSSELGPPGAPLAVPPGAPPGWISPGAGLEAAWSRESAAGRGGVGGGRADEVPPPLHLPQASNTSPLASAEFPTSFGNQPWRMT